MESKRYVGLLVMHMQQFAFEAVQSEPLRLSLSSIKLKTPLIKVVIL